MARLVDLGMGNKKQQRPPTPVPGIYHHFTNALNLELIRAAGVITTTESNVGSGRRDWRPFGEHVGPDVVWLLDVPEVDHPHGLQGSAMDKTAARITVRARAWRWLDWPPAQRMHPEWRDSLIRSAGGYAAVRRWRVVEQPIPESEWLEIVVPATAG